MILPPSWVYSMVQLTLGLGVPFKNMSENDAMAMLQMTRQYTQNKGMVLMMVSCDE